jgi:tRNA nucleotidyltransferase/poly(A) polymerase
MQGNTIAEDLSRRDFTFNAMSIPLQDFLHGKQTVLDPHQGMADLRNRIVRVLPGPIFPDDPLRMLRAFRFAGALQFTIESATLAKIAEFKSQIDRVAPERVYYELSLFLEARNTHPLLAAMNQTGFLECLIPEIRDVGEILQTFKNFDILQSEATIAPGLLSGMVQSLGDKEWSLLKMAALLRRSADAAAALKRLRASNADVAFVDQTLKHHLLALTDIINIAGEPCDESKIYRFTKLGGKELIPSLLLAASHGARNNEPLSSPFTQAILKIYDFYIRRYLPAQEQPVLLTGDDLIKQFKLSPSPLFKTVLDQVEENRTLGTIKTRKEAESLAKSLIDSQ